MTERQARSTERMPEPAWNATLQRVRSEFEEMPCMRITPEQARTLFGLQEPAAGWVLARLERDGVIARTEQGEYVRRGTRP